MRTPPFRLHNTLTQSVETFVPIADGEVRLYVCGLTTYAHAHAGHARCNAVFDVLVRYLRRRGYRVTFVRNVTDVDDKILNRARELGEDPLAFSKRMSEINAAELTAVGCMVPDHEPRVSDHIGEIIGVVRTLIEKGHAYVAPTAQGNDVYFAVRSFHGYGKLSHRKVDDLLAGARVETTETKRDPLDFALWKAAGGDAWGWDSPWGRGRPGWHIECSAMAEKYLGAHFDIHCGGMDLVFPHHENEIAQSECAWGGPFARYWMHNGFVTVDSEKMSKSLGNFVTIKDVLERNDSEAFRYFLLGTHYRGPLNFDVEKLPDGRVVFPGVDEAERRTDYLYSTLEALDDAAAAATPESSSAFKTESKVFTDLEEKVLSALDKDLNTPQALAALGEALRTGNELATRLPKLKKNPAQFDGAKSLCALGAQVLRASASVLGLGQASLAEYKARTRERRLRNRHLDAADVDAKVQARNDAREGRDFARADALRDELAALGVELYDTPAGTAWRVAV